MLFRFSLYGFLKNQRYFEPFLVLFFLERGLDYFLIGLLIGFSQLCINLMEIPTGALADLLGRRRCMILSMVAYVIAFAIFAWAGRVPLYFGAMFFFAVGEAFRTGTHKAIILHWLRLEGRAHEKTRTYGLTRSWAKVGSAVSVAVGACIVLGTRGYTAWLFGLTIIPYLVNIVNLATYPRALEGGREGDVSVRDIMCHLWATMAMVVRRADLRRLLAETMAFEGVYGVVKDYLQPMLRALAIALLFAQADANGRAALVIAPVYVVLELLGSAASRASHRTAALWGGEEGAARRMWWIAFGVFAVLMPLLWFREYALAACGFVLLGVVQNLWRPVQVSRYDSHSEPEQSATILSIDSQAKALAMVVTAPLLGLWIDRLNPGVEPSDVLNHTYWPVAVVGLVASVAMLLFGRRRIGPAPVRAWPDQDLERAASES